KTLRALCAIHAPQNTRQGSSIGVKRSGNLVHRLRVALSWEHMAVPIHRDGVGSMTGQRLYCLGLQSGLDPCRNCEVTERVPTDVGNLRFLDDRFPASLYE